MRLPINKNQQHLQDGQATNIIFTNLIDDIFPEIRLYQFHSILNTYINETLHGSHLPNQLVNHNLSWKQQGVSYLSK